MESLKICDGGKWDLKLMATGFNLWERRMPV